MASGIVGLCLAGIIAAEKTATKPSVLPELRLATLERLARAYGLEVWQLLAPDLTESKLAAKRLPPCRAVILRVKTRRSFAGQNHPPRGAFSSYHVS